MSWLRSRSVEYRADTDDEGPCRPSIHMPRWASRITLDITSVRVEHLQDIGPEDCEAEGIALDLETHAGEYWREQVERDFTELWDSLNAKYGYGWDANPWVWVVEFEQLRV